MQELHWKENQLEERGLEQGDQGGGICRNRARAEGGVARPAGR